MAGSHEGGKFNDLVVSLLNDRFVPFAPSFGDTRDGYDWWQTTMKATWPKLGECTIPGTLWFALTSNGQAVPTAKAKSSDKEGLAAVLKQVLKSYAQLPEAQRKSATPITDANRPAAAPPPGGVVLTVYDHPLLRDGQGSYRRVRDCNQKGEGPCMHIGGPQRDCVWLTAADCQALLPEQAQKGQTQNVSAKLTKRIFLFGLLPNVCWQAGMKWEADSVRQGELKLTVAEVSATRVRLRIHGSVLLVSKARADFGVDRPTLPKDFENRYDAHLEGVLEYDPVQKKIDRWNMAALGDYLGTNYARGAHPDVWQTTPLVMGFSFELNPQYYEVPAGQRLLEPLAWMLRFKRNQQFYWDPDQWEMAEKKKAKR